MTLEKAIKILNENVILSPKASKFKEAVGVVNFALEHQQAVINNLKNDCNVVVVNLEEAFLKECEGEIENAKEQAVREFAEKVKENQRNLFNYVYADVGFGAIIDHLVNEMFGNPEQVKGE